MQRYFSEDVAMIDDMAARFAADVIAPAAAALDKAGDFPADLYKAMAGQGLFGVALEEEAGGSGFGALAACAVMERLAGASGAVGNAFAIPTEAVRVLHHHGNDTQRALIPGILAGEIIPSCAVTEPDAGSDVSAMRTRAVRDGDDWVISGTKAWVTFGRVADMIMVFAKTDPDAGYRGISAFVVDMNTPGISRGKSEELMGMHGLAECQVSFDEVRVPATALLGEEGRAFKMAMDNFNFSRLLMSAMALGMAQAGMEDAMAYATTRKQFGVPIFEHQAVQFMIADMSKDITAARLMIHHAARMSDDGLPYALEAAQAKLFTTDMAQVHISNALQIHGGNGYSREYRIERLYRDVRLSQIYEGTNQIQRVIIARNLEKQYQ
ncbi:acyl-CoA dehydrogenase family protein [Thioclava kandeliae]|uniref:Acyl-CoA dehydrogenase family protein n=1 Tax=Thioclava kandeliae TaxID=3070818 RepID=A0ABV1SM23_9RHOB